MKTKGILTVALLGFVGVSVATLILKETGAGGTTAEPSTTAEGTRPGTTLIAYYLHGNVRCVTCNDIEKTTRETVEASFAGELEAGRIEWRSVNYEEPGNEHFASEFELAAPSVVLATLEDGRPTSWKSLPEVWELIGRTPEFRAFIEEEIREQLREGTPTPPAASAEVPAAPGADDPPGQLPRLVDLGAGQCIPCKQMAPILDELRESYRGRFEVVFLDVWEDPEAAEEYGVTTIPTQIFFDASGTELFRHEGFFSREEILAKWRALGVGLADDRGQAGSSS